MRLLVLTFYYPPDLAAGSFRMDAFVKQLQRHLSSTDQVDIVAASPNRYHSFSVESNEEERQDNIRIHRVPVPVHESGMVDQARTFAAFARGAWKITRARRYDAVLATSSRLFTAFLGALIARREKAALYLDLRDIFTDTIGDVLAGSPLRMILPGLRMIERFTVRSADRINLVSRGFQDYFVGVDASKEYRFFSNGIDGEFLDREYVNERSDGPLQVLYAGNIGAGQGLHRIVPGMARALRDTHEFHIVGDGGLRPLLEEEIREAGVDNVVVKDPVKRSELIDLYADADVLFLHLEDFDAFAKVLPSKVFEYAATGKPILAGVRGYAAKFIGDEIDNAHVVQPCDVEQAVGALRSLKLDTTPRMDFIDRYRRDAIMDKFVSDFVEMATSGGRRR